MSDAANADAATPAAPALRVVRGTPDAAELAALVAVLAARGGEPVEERATVGGWRDPRTRLRRVPVAGPGAWRASARLR